MRRPLMQVAIAVTLVACTSPDYINLVHPDHPEELQRVNTVAKAREFFANTTLVSRTGQGPIVTKEFNGQEFEVPDRSYRADYIEPGGRALYVVEGGNGVVEGRWTIEQFGRGYPRLCRSFPVRSTNDENVLVMSDWYCEWPAKLFKESFIYSDIYRGDVLNLSSQRIPDGLRNHQSGTTLTQFLQRAGVDPASQSSLKIVR